MIPKPKKKVSRSYLKKKADALFSKKIRAKGKCELAGLDHIECSSDLQCAHIFGRSNMRLRFDEKNVMCICSGHHRWYTSHPYEWFNLVGSIDKKRFDYLLEHKEEKVKLDYYEVIEKFK